MPTACLVTLGCKVNQCDTEALAEGLRASGWRVRFGIQAAAEDPDVIVVNSCAVTARSEAKSRQAVRRLIREHPRSRVVLAGCYPQVSPAAAGAIEGLAGLAGTGRSETLELLLALAATPAGALKGARNARGEAGFALPACFEALPARARPGRIRAFLKVQDGCPGRCTYCVVPLARGAPRSRPLDGALEEASRFLQGGARELVLTGIQLGLYGQDLGGVDLADLVRGCLRLPGLIRLRLSSVEPTDVSPRLLEAISSSPKACPHLHVPLQSGSDAVLRRMGRPQETDGYRRVVEAARRAVPDLALSTDLIAGFPGETGREFEETVEFVRNMGFMRLHVFPFSRRPGTVAARLPDQIPAAVREERSRALIAIGRELALAFHGRLVGRDEDVLLERDSMPLRSPEGPAAAEGRFLNDGLTGQYVRAEVVSAECRARGDLVSVRVESATAEGVRGGVARPGGS